MKSEEPKVAVSLHEIGTFIAYAAIIAVIAVGMYAVAPKGFGQIIGVAFAVALLPVPAVVLYFTRWRKLVR
ncbi:MAG: hypothetical protein H7A44_07905 [Opitutaceae bacterium]|nr:hypothetical protein [Opitutaceae bacterium]